MNGRHDSVILHFVVRVFMVPFILVFGAYVFLHGESSPGGGFQAGAIVAAAIVLATAALAPVVARALLLVVITPLLGAVATVLAALTPLAPLATLLRLTLGLG